MSLMCGGGGGGEVELTEEEKKANAAVEKDAAKNATKQGKIVKMLLLGAGESGKSTIFKQMKVINKGGYTAAELQEFKGIVHSNVCISMAAMINACNDKLSIDLGAVKGTSETFMNTVKDNENITPEVGKMIADMWASEPIKAAFLRRAEYQLNDSTESYMSEIDRISGANYVPTEQDVLKSRVRTTGIVQSEFIIKSIEFAMFDVGGQRNERRKWIHCFDNVDAVVFVASLSEFDQVLFEDANQNRLDEAIDLFAQIVNSKWFKETSMILFLNKKDLFERKLAEGKNFASYVNTSETRMKYDGPNEMKPCADYCKTVFLEKNKAKDKTIYSHVTTAIDTSNIKFVFSAVVAMILESNLKNSGLVN